MNLLLRAHDNLNDVTWSVVIMLVILLAGVTYYIYTIMSYAFKELKDGKDGTTVEKELLQLSSDGD
tara:strand:+ start:4211 stop:4408 length:198 start_codon:yes stop_codon:yes gene_type:complete